MRHARSAVPGRRRRAVLVAATVLAACGGPAGSPAGSRAGPAPGQHQLSVALDPGERSLAGPVVRTGTVVFQPIGISDDLPAVVGTHAELDPTGVFLRLRLAVRNTGQDAVTIDPARQLLFTAGGTAIATDYQAMLVRRTYQPIALPPNDLMTLELWWDLPLGTRVRAFRLVAAGLPSVLLALGHPVPAGATGG